MQEREGEGQHWAAIVALIRKREIWEIMRNKLRSTKDKGGVRESGKALQKL